MDMAVLKNYKITDPFWGRVRGLVRRELLPYQWEALNDRVEGAAGSFCVHNFRAAARLNARRGEPGFTEPAFSDPGFQIWPEPGEEPDPDKFYGFVFQDSDLYKWLEAASYVLMDGPDPALEAKAAEAARLICAAQHPGGYLDTYFILNGMDGAFTNLENDHELYCMGHLIEAAVAYREATGREDVLNAARRFADLVYEKMGPGGPIPGFPGHEIAEMALARLYEHTGEGRYLALARLFIDRRGQEPDFFDAQRRARLEARGRAYTPDADRERRAYAQAHMPVREQREAVGHAVRAMYLYSGMADAARLGGDEDLRRACRELWHSAVGEKMYITGGVGGTSRGEAFSYPFDLPSDAAYAETCAAVGLVFFARRMLELEGGGEYADVMERALYNAVLAGVSLDGRSFFYVNPLEAVPEAIRRDGRLEHVKPVRQKWFGCACCPPNLARLAASVGAYAAVTRGDTLRVELYVGGELTARLPGGVLRLKIDSGLPWRGYAALTVTSPEPAEGRIALRLPGWTEPEGVELTAPEGTERTREGRYIVLSGTWRPGDRVELRLPMPVRVTAADPRVRECAGRAAVTRGPVVYCAEEADNGPDLHLWRLDSRRLGEIAPVETQIRGVPVTALDAPALRRPGRAEGLYVPWTPPEEEPGTLRLIPYFAWANRGQGEMRVWLGI